MSPLFMDTGCELDSPGSLSAEDSRSNTAGSEREGDGQQIEKRGTKRQEKNRDAARKSRRKQTERADDLHEELQSLERSNSALQKEIASLKKDLNLYTTALERHEPFCCIRDSSSKARLSVSPSAGCQTNPSPPRVPPQAPAQTAAPSLSTSLTSSLGLQALNCVDSTHPSSSTTTPASSTSSSPGLFTCSSSVNAPYSVSFSTFPAPHSLFSDDPPSSLVTSRPTNATPVCTSLFLNRAPSSSLTTAAANARFSALHPGAVDLFRMKQTSNVVPPYSSLASGAVAQGCPMNVPQLHPGNFTANPANSSTPHSLLPSAPLDRALQCLSSLETSPASGLSSDSNYGQPVTPSPASLLSLLTHPSPLDMARTTSSSCDGPLSQLPPLGDPSRDLFLSELLEVDDWILQ